MKYLSLLLTIVIFFAVADYTESGVNVVSASASIVTVILIALFIGLFRK
ncbi:hypothetical protein NLX67_20055 [Domibacillus sp. A3M-37]|nr:hypothetical protein [Domibacillus sp. A3M-37]MCP3764638.1 hypothetical protein [Domibacillus sp. A3M-37]